MKIVHVFLIIVLLCFTAQAVFGQNCPPGGPFPHPHVSSSFMPDSSCLSRGNNGTSGQPDKNSCLYACENSFSTFCTANNAGSSYIWVVVGGSIVAGQGTSCVTVHWGPAGSGNINVTETNSVGCSGNDGSCVQIINSPVAAFHVDTTVCRSVTLNFQDQSVNASTWHWDFGDGGTSSVENPLHAYATGGTYTVTLVVTNVCGCSDSVSKTIHVSNLVGPNIECPATVCAYTEGCYSTTDTCPGAVYHWSVTGGTFTAPPTGHTVCVNWGSGPVGTLSLSITGCSTTCPDTTTVVVPIIGSTATISGPAVVCPNDISTYTLPTWPGTYYTWTLGTGGTIIAGTYSQSATVQWGPAPGIYTLSVTWHNILLGCGGSATLQVQVRDKFIIGGASGPFCLGDSTIYNAVAPANWTVTGGTITPPATNTSSIVVHWTASGVQTVIASPVNSSLYCNLADSMHAVVDFVPKALSLSGPQSVCPSTVYQYTATTSGPGFNLQWSVTGGGTIVGSSTANPVTVSWTGPGTVAVQQVQTSSPFCKSDTIALNVSLFTLSGITGPNLVCMDQSVTYTAGSPNPGVTYTWAIMNGTNPSPYGSITGGQGTNQITVLWHGPGNLSATVQLTVCGNVYTLPVTITPVPTPTITMTGHVCDPGGSMTLTASPGYSSYTWSNSMVGQSIVVYSSGTYTVTVTAPGSGCTGSASIVVPHTPGPTAQISTPNPLSWCTGGPPVLDTLYALQGAGYQYLWSPGGQLTPTIVVTSPGTYSVTVTDINTGCTATDAITITQQVCQPSSCTPVGTASFVAATPICNPVSFTGSWSSIASPSWNFGDPASLGANTSPTVPTVSHLFTHAGWFTVSFGGTDANGCQVVSTQAIPIPLAADFSFSSHCDTVHFTDNSTYLPPNAITSWVWSFPGGSPSSATGPNPGPVTYSTNGPHSVTLTVSNGICTTPVTKTVTIGNLPTGTITAAATGCAGNDVIMTGGGSGVVDWSWNFGDGATSATQNTQHAYTLPGTYTITLTVSDSFGCMSSTSQSILINPPLLGCSITATGPTTFCAGDSVTLKAAPGPGYTYQWYNNNTAIPSATGMNYSATVSGNYTVTVTDPNGCLCTAGPVAVVANPKPPALITSSSPPLICGSGLITLCAPAGPYTYLWSDINATTTQCLTVYLNTPGPQPFTVTVTDPSTGCTSTSVPFIVLVAPTPPPPTISVTGSTTLCKGDSVKLISSSPGGNIWSTGATTQSITVHAAGTYTVTVTYPSGCTASASISVKSQEPDFSLFPLGCDSLCDSVKIPGPVGAYPGYYTYQWFFNGSPIAAPNGTNDTLTPVGSGTYSLILTGPGPAFCKDTSGGYNLKLHDCDSLRCHSTICGQKIDDIKGNHSCDSVMIGIPNWKICLVKCNVDNYPTGDTIECTKTDSNGYYCFHNLCKGDYCVVEEHRAGWQQTWPVSPPFYHISLGDSQNVTGVNFFNHKKQIVIWTTVDTVGVSHNPILTAGDVLPPDVQWPVVVTYSSDNGSTWQPVYNGLLFADVDPIPHHLPGKYSIKRRPVANYQFDRIYVDDTLRAERGDSIVVDLPDTTQGATIVMMNVFVPDTTVRFRTFTADQLAGVDQAKPVKRPGKKKPIVWPNTANLIDELMKGGASLFVGLPHQLNAVGKEKGYLQPANQSDVYKTFDTKGVVHTQSPHGLDYLAGKPIMKRQKNLIPTKFNDVLLANLLALQVNIAASAATPPRTPAGFGDLVYDNGESDPLSGLTVSGIAAYASNLMTNWEYHDTLVFDSLNAVVARINAAFAKPLPIDNTDTLVWLGGKLQLRGVVALTDVPFLKRVSGMSPATAKTAAQTPQLPRNYTLYQNYPNPFNPTTIITFDLPEPSFVTITVYDVIGREVATLVDHQLLDGGEQQVEFNAVRLASGVYFYKMAARAVPAEQGQTGRTFVDVKKMLLLR
ncbi:MAG TPA: PKD domain-containing protein [Bacteroidota bacterium]|nr:PKD domain-containing protein [Bacteroidota bacterium]